MELHEQRTKNNTASDGSAANSAGSGEESCRPGQDDFDSGRYANRAEVQAVIREFVSKMKESDEFCLYRETAAELALYPIWKSRVQELRKKNYQLQNSGETPDLYVALERLQEEYKDIYSNAVTANFLNAEVAVCRIIQQLNEELIDSLDFESVLDP